MTNFPTVSSKLQFRTCATCVEGPSYLQNKEKQYDYLVKHPCVAKKLNINIVSVEKKG